MPQPPRAPRSRSVCVALALVAAGCAAVDPDPQWAGRSYPIAAADSFAAAATLAHGFDAPGAVDAFAAGDEVVFGLRLTDHGEVREWTLVVTVVDPALPDVLGPEFEWNGERARMYERYHALLAEARVHDGAGRQVGVDRLELSRDHLRSGLVAACREAAARRADPATDGHDGSADVAAREALRDLMRVIRGSPVLRDILWQVISLPSVWSILGHFGVRVRQHHYFDQARPGAPFAAGEALATWELPVEVTLNGAPALRCIVVATEPRSPCNLCTGVVAITAVHPFDPEVTFAMRLLGARRGR